jgi:hypothetical protein
MLEGDSMWGRDLILSSSLTLASKHYIIGLMDREYLYDSGKFIFLAFFAFTLSFYLTTGYLFLTITDACSGIDCFKINEHTSWQIIYWTIGLSLPIYFVLRTLLSTLWGSIFVKSFFGIVLFSLCMVALVIIL